MRLLRATNDFVILCNQADRGLAKKQGVMQRLFPGCEAWRTLAGIQPKGPGLVPPSRLGAPYAVPPSVEELEARWVIAELNAGALQAPERRKGLAVQAERTTNDRRER